MNQPLTSNNDQFHIQQSDLEHLFSQLNPQEVEQFYQFYRTWQQQGRVEQLIHEIETFRWQIAENDVLLRQAQPSTMVQADIALLETRGVIDIDLLDRMVGRGEIWLNRTIDQLQHCEKLNMIGESYEAWCEHALEGAYEWISTMEENVPADENTQTGDRDEDKHENYDTGASLIEDAFLKKLMSEENEASNPANETAPSPNSTDTTALESPLEQYTSSQEHTTVSTTDTTEPTAITASSDQDDQNQADGENDNTEWAARVADEEGLGDIEAQSPEDLEIEAQQVADFEQNTPEDATDTTIPEAPDDQSIDTPDQADEAFPVDASPSDDALPTTNTLPSDTPEAPDTQTQQDSAQTNIENINAHADEKDDRHWPYILDTGETDANEDVAQSYSPEQRLTERDAANTQAQQENAHQELTAASQEPQSLVQKLLTKVLRR